MRLANGTVTCLRRNSANRAQKSQVAGVPALKPDGDDVDDFAMGTGRPR